MCSLTFRHFYRDELFEQYLERKLKTADLFLQTITTTVSPISTNQSLQRVLEICVERMISTWEFSNVPMSVIPQELQTALYSLLDEELIIRKDVARDHVFAAASDALNFTFDELRDYMLAQYLLHRVFPANRDKFASLLNKSDADRSQPTEGLKKFLFYASRKRRNDAFYHFYQSLSWYADVYDTEVFNLDVRVLDEGDRMRICERLATNDYHAVEIAKRLSFRWDEGYWPLLNVGLLIEFTRSSRNETYRKLILQTFGARRRGDDDCLGVEFCTFATEIASRQDFVDRLDDFRPVVEFLILLLPVEKTSLLGSPAYDALMNFLRRSAGYITNLLLESLDYSCDDHKPFVWRLLYEAFGLTNDERITARATSALGNRSSLKREELTEVERIVQHRLREGMPTDDILTELDRIIRNSAGKRRTMIKVVFTSSLNHEHYVISLSQAISKADFLKRAGVRPDSYAGRLVERIHEGLFESSLDLKRDFDTYYKGEYTDFATYLRKRHLFSREDADDIQRTYPQSAIILYYTRFYSFFDEGVGETLLMKLLGPEGKG